MKRTKILGSAGFLSLLLLLSFGFFKLDAYAATKRTETLEVNYYKEDKADADEGWSWEYSTKTLTLKDVDFEVEDAAAICLPRESCKIIVEGTNKLVGGYAAVNYDYDYEDMENYHIGTLTVEGSGSLDITSVSKAFEYSGDMVVKDIKLSFNTWKGFGFVSHLILDNVSVYAIGNDPDYSGRYGLISVYDEDEKDASLTLKNCYVKEGGAQVKQSSYCSFIGTSLNKSAKKIVIERGASPYKVAKVSTKTMKFSKNFTQVGISWNVPKYASGTYTVWRSTKKGSGYKKIATVSRPYYKDKGRAFHKTYYYKIRAYTKGKSNSYSVSGYKGVTTGLARVNDIQYRYNTYSDDLHWTKVYGAQGYKIYRASSAKGKYTCIKTIKKGSILKYNAKRPKKNKDYFYRIRAYRKKGKKTYYSGYTYAYSDDYEPAE